MSGGLFQIAGTITKVSTMANRSLRVQVDTQEEVGEESMARLMGQLDKYGWFCFLVGEKEMRVEDVLDIPALPKWEEDKKSPAQRLRAALYVLWKQKKPDMDADAYYRQQVERFIEAVKEQLV